MSLTSRAFFPTLFLDQMHDLLPDEADFARFIAISQQPLRRSLRVNTLKIDVAEFLRQIEPYRWSLAPIPWCAEGFWVTRDSNDDAIPLGSTAGHLAGLYYLQEASSMLPVTALFADDQMPERVMDLAAAPGSKTTQIAAKMRNHGVILANEYSSSRVKVLHANLSRCGVSNVAITHFDGRVFGAALPETFDAILLDAPCSGEGVIRKDATALQNWSPESIAKIASTQRDLIDSAFHALRPGGTLVYSTCTLNRQENQQVIAWLMQRYTDAVAVAPLNQLFDGAEDVATPEGFLHVFPQRFDSEGFFVARLVKRASVPALPTPGYNVGVFPFSRLNHTMQHAVITAAAAAGLIWHSEHYSLWQRDNTLWLFPHALSSLMGKVRFSRIGIKLAEKFPKGYRWQHEAAIALGDPKAKNSVILTAEQAECWYRGRDIYPESDLPGDELLLVYQQQPIGIAKRVGNRIKNNYPRERVRDGRLN